MDLKIFPWTYFLATLFSTVSIAVGRQVKSFDEMKSVEKYEELQEYGLVAPGQSSHQGGKNLILLSLKVGSFQKGNWVLAHGLLGASMINVSVYDRAGYESLFLSLCDRSKYYNSYSNGSAWAWLKLSSDKFSLVETNSIIVKRENVIGFLTWEINNRFVFDSKGKYGRIYAPDPRPTAQKRLYDAFKSGLKILSELKDAGFDDKCLRNLLGVTYAILKFDGFYSKSFIEDMHEISRPIQIYSDALIATISDLKETPNHSKNFWEEYYWQANSREIGDGDTFLFPEDEKELSAIQKLVSSDLDRIELKGKKTESGSVKK